MRIKENLDIISPVGGYDADSSYMKCHTVCFLVSVKVHRPDKAVHFSDMVDHLKRTLFDGSFSDLLVEAVVRNQQKTAAFASSLSRSTCRLLS